jgi:plasmid stability protein
VYIPRDVELSAVERAILRRALAAPSLWPLQVAAGAVGLDAAVEACGQPERLPPAARAALEQASYDPDRSLPSRLDVARLIAGVRLHAAREPRRVEDEHRPVVEPLATTATRLGYTLREAQASLRAIRHFCGTEQLA